MHERVEQRGNGGNETAERKARLERQCGGKSQHELDNEQHDDWVAYRQRRSQGDKDLNLRQQIRWRGRIICQMNRENRERNPIARQDGKDWPLAWM